MSPTPLMAGTGLAALLLVGAVLSAVLPAAAQSQPPHRAVARPRVEVNPRLLYRRCTSWYVLQYRPSGAVLFPQKHCWWVRG